MSSLRRQLPKGMWPLRWMRYTCNRTHKRSCLSPSRSSDSRTDLLVRVLPFYAFYIFWNSILAALGDKREQQTRRAGSVPGRRLIKNHFNVRLPAHGEKCLRRDTPLLRLSPFYANAYIEASSVMLVWRHIGNNCCPSHVSETLFSTNNNYSFPFYA